MKIRLDEEKGMKNEIKTHLRRYQGCIEWTRKSNQVTVTDVHQGKMGERKRK